MRIKPNDTTWLLLSLLLVVAAIFFWPVWRAPDGFLYRPNSDISDLTVTHWPNALFIRHSLATWGQVPLWRPLILGGEPFAANPLSGLWYPPNLLLLVLPLSFAFNLLFVLHAAWAGWGGYALARSVGGSRAGGLLAACTVMFTPKAIAHLASGHVGLYCAWAWLPWTLWAARRLGAITEDRPYAGRVATLAVAASMLILADVRLGFYGGLAAAGCWVVSGKWQVAKSRWQIAMGVGSGLLVLTLVAVQMVPLAAVAGRLNRGGLSLEESGIASLPPGYLVGLLVADHGGFQEWMTYLGVVGLLLALVGLVLWKGRGRWWWGGVTLAAGVYSLGIHTPLYGLLYRILPPLRWLRGPARAWFLVVLSAAVLAAQGLTALEKGLPRRRWANLAAAGCAGMLLAGGVGGWAMNLPANVVLAALILPATGLLVALRVGNRLRAALFVGLTLALALADLWIVGFTLYRVRPAEEVLAEGQEAAAWLAGQPSPFRVYSPSYSIPQHTGAVYGIETVDGVDPFQLADYAAFMRAATGVDVPGYSVTVPSFSEIPEGEDMLLAHKGVVPDLELLGLLNVRYLVAAYPMAVEGVTPLGERGGVYLYQNEYALPRALVRTDEQGGAEARVIEWTPNRIRVEAEGPGLLVLSEVYDPDWRVQVDGEAAAMVRVDGILRGVDLDTGHHQVTFLYWPAGLETGLVLTGLGVLCVVVLWIVEWRGFRGRKSSAFPKM